MIHHNSGNLIQNPDHFSSCCIFKNVNWSTGFQQRVCALHELPSAAFCSDFCDTVALKWPPPWPRRSGAHTFRRRFTLRHKLASMQKKTHYTPSLLENSRGVLHLLPWKYPGALEIFRTWKKPGPLEYSRAPGKIQVSWKFPGGDLISHWTSSAPWLYKFCKKFFLKWVGPPPPFEQC